MARSFVIKQGEDETPESDLTDATSPVHVIWEEVEAGGRAFRGESNTSTIPMRDEQGQTGNSLDLPSGLDNVSISRGSRWYWLDGPDGDEVRMAVGRVGTKDYSRGRQKADRARELVMTAGDSNEDLQLIIIDDWVRPEETDVARVNALITTYLNGDPRPTTVISNTYVASGSTITLDAKTYDGVTPLEVLQEISQLANKNVFVTVDDELWYDTWDSTTYPAGISISDRPAEWSMEGVCSSGADTFLGSAASNANTELNTDNPDWPGAEEERVEITLAADVAVGDTIILVAAWNYKLKTGGIYDEQGNTWGLDAYHINTASSADDVIEIWRCNVTNPLSSGDYIRYAMQISGTPWGGRAIGAWSYAGALGSPDVGTGAGTINGLISITAPAGDVVIAGASVFGGSGELTPDGDWDSMVAALGVSGTSDNVKAMIAQQLTEQGGTNPWTVAISPNRDWSAIAVGYTRTGGGGTTLVFPPKWDVGPSSTEDGLDLLCGLRLYYGQDGAYVSLHDDITHDEYWHAEKSFYTNDPAINTSGKADVLAAAIHERIKREDRTYNVSIGPLGREQVGCIKYGQLLYIKARAIPDADDQYVPRRIAQLRWTTPVPGVFWARMQLDRPIKEAPYSVGPKQGHDTLELHKEGTSHPASAIVITDAGAYFSGNDVEAALQELGAAGPGGVPLGWFNVTDYGATGDGTTDDTSDINSAIAALNSAGRGVLYFPAGDYLISSALTTITVACRILGDGMAAGGTSFSTYASRVKQSSDTANAFTIGAHGYSFEGLAIMNSEGSPTAGAGIAITANGDHGQFRNISVEGFYINVDIQEGAEWRMAGCHLLGPITYGLKIRHIDLPDGGDGSISDTWITAEGVNSTAGIRLESGGGLKLTNVKINGRSHFFGDGIQVAMAGSIATIILMVSNSSIENITGHGINITQVGTSTFSNIILAGNQFGLHSNNTGKAISIVAEDVAALDHIVISNSVFSTDGTARSAIQLTNVDNVMLAGNILVDNFTSLYTNSGSTNITELGTGGASDLDDLTDVTISSATLDDDLRYNGSVWVNDARKWEAVTDGEDVFVWDGDDLVHDWST